MLFLDNRKRLCPLYVPVARGPHLPNPHILGGIKDNCKLPSSGLFFLPAKHPEFKLLHCFLLLLLILKLLTTVARYTIWPVTPKGMNAAS